MSDERERDEVILGLVALVGDLTAEIERLRARLGALEARAVPGGWKVVADPTVPRSEIHIRDAEGNLLGKITDVR